MSFTVFEGVFVHDQNHEVL